MNEASRRSIFFMRVGAFSIRNPSRVDHHRPPDPRLHTGQGDDHVGANRAYLELLTKQRLDVGFVIYD